MKSTNNKTFPGPQESKDNHNGFPYSKTDSSQKICYLSGRGNVFCTESIRIRKITLCGKCPNNPDNIVLDPFLLEEKRGLDLFE